MGSTLVVPAVNGSVKIVSGNNQTGPSNGMAAEPLVARVIDSMGVPVAGVNVGFFVSTGNATPSQPFAITDENGLANTSIAFAASPSAVQVNVVAAGYTGATFSLTIGSAVAPGPPFGSFDTPANNSTVAGALGVTGWALSSAGISSVDVWRQPNPGENGGAGLVLIGTAVPGPRADIATLYPGYPGSSEAGWGLQVLTNELPSNSGNAGTGNGTYVLHAIAHGNDGQSTDLGTKTIIVNNAGSVLPFGTIDTPAQGGVVSGTDYVNFGWALTPPGKMIPVDGSTIVVYIDGKPMGHPVYNQYRSDVANAFPGYANSGGSVGYLRIDTTMLANGIHTIAWSVTDNAGLTSGIGSRFFIVQN